MKFKKLIILFIIILSICILPSCAETPDEPVTDNPPSENPPEDNPPEQLAIEEQLKAGMTYEDITNIIGSDGVKQELPGNIYLWEIDGRNFYVWFSENNAKLRCEKFGYRNELKIELGTTTQDDMEDILNSSPTKDEKFLGFTIWRHPQTQENIYTVFEEPADSEHPILKHYFDSKDETITTALSIEKEMSDDDVNALLGIEGTHVLASNEVYYWNIAEGFNLIAHFNVLDNKTIVLNDYIYSTISTPIGESYDSICKEYGNQGAKCVDNIVKTNEFYEWKTPISNVNLYARIDENNLITDFAYMSDLEIGIGKLNFEVRFILGEAKDAANLFTQNYYAMLWDYTEDRQLICTFDPNARWHPLKSISFDFPEVAPINVGMSVEEVIAILGEPNGRLELNPGYILAWAHDSNYRIQIYFVDDFVENKYIIIVSTL